MAIQKGFRIFPRQWRWAACLVFCSARVFAAEPSITTKRMTIGMLDMVWDATRSKLFASAASKVVIIDTDAAKIVDTIATDGTADRIAVSDDGKYLYAAI